MFTIQQESAIINVDSIKNNFNISITNIDILNFESSDYYSGTLDNDYISEMNIYLSNRNNYNNIIITKYYLFLENNSIDDKTSKIYKSIKKKSEKSGISMSILKQVYKRGMAAWNSSHYAGTPQQAWATGRVNSFITGKGGSRKADSDLWSKVKEKRKRRNRD